MNYLLFDQIGAPTSAELIADISAHAIVQTLRDQTKIGIYHLVASGKHRGLSMQIYI